MRPSVRGSCKSFNFLSNGKTTSNGPLILRASSMATFDPPRGANSNQAEKSGAQEKPAKL
jgi:hypothetical protein